MQVFALGYFILKENSISRIGIPQFNSFEVRQKKNYCFFFKLTNKHCSRHCPFPLSTCFFTKTNYRGKLQPNFTPSTTITTLLHITPIIQTFKTETLSKSKLNSNDRYTLWFFLGAHPDNKMFMKSCGERKLSMMIWFINWECEKKKRAPRKLKRATSGCHNKILEQQAASLHSLWWKFYTQHYVLISSSIDKEDKGCLLTHNLYKQDIICSSKQKGHLERSCWLHYGVTQKKRSLPSTFSCSPSSAAMDIAQKP